MINAWKKSLSLYDEGISRYEIANVKRLIKL